MAVFRIHKSKDFTVMSNHHLRNKELSLKAKGLLTLMLSLPDDWDYSVLGLAAMSKDGKDAVMSAISELTDSGYVVVDSHRNSKGQYESEYNVYETPNRESRCGNSESDNPPQLNTNKESTDTKYYNDEDNSSSRINTSKNNISSSRKNSKKEFDLSFVNVQFEETFKKWLRYKEERKEMYKTQMTLEENYRRLLNMANNDPWTAQQIVDYTISGGWMGYCMPKQQNNYGNSSTKTQQPVNRFQELAKHFPNTGGVL